MLYFHFEDCDEHEDVIVNERSTDIFPINM